MYSRGKKVSVWRAASGQPKSDCLEDLPGQFTAVLIVGSLGWHSGVRWPPLTQPGNARWDRSNKTSESPATTPYTWTELHSTVVAGNESEAWWRSREIERDRERSREIERDREIDRETARDFTIPCIRWFRESSRGRRRTRHRWASRVSPEERSGDRQHATPSRST